MGKHSKGIVKDQFCALRSPKCGDNQSHRDNSATKWTKTAVFQQGKSKSEKEFEAHHLLCVASVTQFVAKKRDIAEIVKQTKWCINKKHNMLAMPLWGHTIKHYCDVETRGVAVLDRLRNRNTKKPGFKNIPQHDYDHNSSTGYKKEIDARMTQIAKDIAKNKNKHKAMIKSLRGKLNTASTSFRDVLKARGIRGGGTHDSWFDGKEKKSATWYEAFSMADDGNVEKRSFPGTAGDSRLADKIKSLVRAYA